MASTITHLVVPGQIIAEGDDFLRGHGTYVETTTTTTTSEDGDDTPISQERLVASVAGRVERVNKLVSVIPVSSSMYQGHVGDLIIGRITSVQNTRWKVCIGNSCRSAQLPLSGVHLPGGVQRVRTQQDSREMRQLFQEGDLVCAEVHNVQGDGSLSLHTRSLVRYGKLENGCLIIVPPSLVARRKNHFCIIDNKISLLLGMNGYIWIQRALPHEQKKSTSSSENNDDENNNNNNDEKSSSMLLAEHQEKLNKEHKETPVSPDERQCIARIRNSIECLSKVHLMVTPEHIEVIYKASKTAFSTNIAAMLHPENILILTGPLMK